jgi:hypothetical protein
MHLSVTSLPGRSACVLAGALLTAAVLCRATVSEAKDEPQPAGILLLKPAEAPEPEYRALEQALDAHLRQLEIGVELHPVTALPTDPREQEDQAQEILGRDGVEAVVWIDLERRAVTLIYRNPEGHESRLERRIDCISPHLGRCSDTIASVISSAISSWAQPPSKAAQQQEPTVEYAVDNELSPLELSKPPWTKPHPLVRVSLAAGYGVVPFDGTSSAAHGFDVGLWARVVRYVIVEALFDFYWPLSGDSSELGAEIEIRRWDVVGRLGGALPLDRFLLALTAGMVFDFAEVESVTDEIEVDGRGERRKGLSTALLVTARLVHWLSLWVSGGVDVLDSDLVYRGSELGGDSDLLIRCDAVQGRVLVGVAIGIDLGSMGAG